MATLGVLERPWVAVLFALLMTAVATLVCALLQRALPAANLLLVYTAAVIITATSTRVLPALVSAFSGFLAFNFFFTEPRGTLLMTHREDVLTAALFLLIASLVGSLAGRLQGKVSSLEFRDSFARIEHRLLENISTAMEAREVLMALQLAIGELSGRVCHAVCSGRGMVPEWASLPADFPDAARQQIERALLAGKENSLQLETGALHRSVRLVSDAEGGSVAILLGGEQTGLSTHAQVQNNEAIDILLRQASLGLRRIQLLRDLARERIDKERELLRSSLLSSVSHDFRTPLTAMVGATTTLLEMRGDLTQAQQDELLESVLSEASRLDNYTQNLLDMTRLGQGELTLDRSWVSIEEIINVVMKRVRPLATAHRLEVTLAPDVPLLRVHPALIEQAIFNVLHNALKFSPLGSLIQLRCARLATDPDRPLLIEVADEGPGIPESERENVFRLFHSAERGDRRAAGTGLGLAICKGMIGAHGGRVRIGDRAEGHGCLVQMILPLEESGL
jgi:two-component system sensor histidine kinase KdpD